MALRVLDDSIARGIVGVDEVGNVYTYGAIRDRYREGYLGSEVRDLSGLLSEQQE
jgi:hypothetical protein